MFKSLDVIFSALTPYLCIFALLGVGLFLRQWRKHSKIVWGIGVCSLFALVWRLVYSLASSRYALFLTLPAIVLSLYAIVKLPVLLPRIKPCRIRILQFAMIIALPLGLLLKSWHFNPYYNSLRELGEIAKKDAGNFTQASFFDHNIHENRFAYYSGLSRDEGLKKDVGFSALLDLAWFVDSDRAFYIVAQTGSAEECSLLDVLAKLPGKTVKLAERFVNRKNSRKFVLYRYMIQKNDSKFVAAEISQYQKNLYRNGDFEKIIPLPKDMGDFFKQRGGPFFSGENITIPSGIEISWLGGYSRITGAETEAVSSDAIAGKYSLRLKNDGRFGVVYSAKPGNYKYTLLLKALKDSQFTIILFHYNPRFTEIRRIATRKVPQGEQVWQYEISIPESVLGKCTHFWVVFALQYGEVLLDNVSLTKI